MSSLRSLTLAAVTLVILAATAIPGTPAPAAPRTAQGAAPSCPGQGPLTTDLKGIAAEARPVVLVHGWRGDVLQPLRGQLEDKPDTKKWQYFVFDYADHNTDWADSPTIAACLAAYIEQVSDAHRDRGGNGIVYLVGHSMGGLAARFALDPNYGGIDGLGRRVGGIVTIDTPHRGSSWGGTIAAWGITTWDEKTLPGTDTDAWKCLAGAVPGGQAFTWNGCARPAYLPHGVQLAQIAGDITLHRKVFGINAYDVPLSGDGIVSLESQNGYLGSVDGRSRTRTSSDTVKCDGDLFDIALGGGGGFLFAPGQDTYTMELFAGQAPTTPDIAVSALELWLRGLTKFGCFHTEMPSYPATVTLVNARLSTMAERVESFDLDRLASATAPASCGHEATRLVNYGADFGSDGFAGLARDGDAGPVTLDITGDGLQDAVAVLACSAGGVTHPETLVVYERGPELAGSVYLGDVGEPAEHGDVEALTVDGTVVQVQWLAYDGAGYGFRRYTADLAWAGAGPELVDVTEIPIEGSCGEELEDAVLAEYSFGDVEVERCDGKWAYLGDADGQGDTEQLWLYSPTGWARYTGFPTSLCSYDVEREDAPPWVVDLFAYRDC